MKPERIGYVVLSVSDPDVSRSFYSGIFTFEASGRPATGGVALSSGSNPFEILLLPNAQPGARMVPRLGYQMADRDALAQAERRLKEAGVACQPLQPSLPGVLSGVSFQDPEGNTVDLFVAEGDGRRKGGKPSTFGEIRPIPIRKLGHVVIKVRDRDGLTTFYQKTLGLTLSEHNQLGMAFLRCGRDHHDLGLIPLPPGQSPGLHHAAFDVGNILEMANAVDFLRQKGIPIEKGPGFWGQGHQVELYFFDPDHHAIEIYCNIDQMEKGEYLGTTPSAYRSVSFGPLEVRKEFQKF